MSAKVLTVEEAKAANVLLIEEEGKGQQAVHDLITAYRANRRAGTACTKTRGEIRGTGKKMYRQKGTGNARHGTKKAPIFVGGGVVFGPRPRDYSKTVNKKTRKVALRKVLGETISAGIVRTVSSFSIAEPKTKAFVKQLEDLGAEGKVLIIAPSFEDNTYLAARNVSSALLMTAHEVNIEQMLHSNTIILVDGALEILAARTA